ncbi:MAG: hypothetical protein C9356_12515 [Oleiphilus sp.]|nr:MAG: hypothetical protein C9356_12515 [Oleiphilus sp.]
MRKVSLSINGTRYLDWHSMTVIRSLEHLPWRFEAEVRNGWQDDAKRRIRRGDAVQVKYGEEVLITGYVDEVLADYDAHSHQLTIMGRSKLGDLVDCTASGESSNQQSLAKIAKALCKPFGIEVVDHAKKNKPYVQHVVTAGEGVMDYLEERSRIRGVRLSDSPEGNLHIVDKPQHRSETALVLGRNILSATSQRRAQSLYSNYVILGEFGGLSAGSASQKVQINAEVTDPFVKRHRPLFINTATSVDDEDAATRAEIQKRVHRSRAERHTYTVKGWTQDNGRTWLPGMLVAVRDAYTGVQEDLLIMESRLTLGEDGETSELLMMPKYAVERAPVPEEDNEEFTL